MENKELSEVMLGDIILCDPITSKGRKSLNNLGLTDKDVSPSFFYKNLCVESQYEKNKKFCVQTNNHTDNSKCLYYQYTVNNEQFKEAQARLEEFNSRFHSNSQNEYPLLMLGVAGNGKSIDVNRRIREVTAGEKEVECGRLYLDLEDAFTKKTYGMTYSCPDPNSSLWLFCIKLLDSIMKYIKRCCSLCSTIYMNFCEDIVKNNLANKELIMLFENIGKYSDGDNNVETAIFESLIKLLTSKDGAKDIQTLLETLMILMYCSAKDKKHYIIIDNIEQYIKLNTSKIQIPNSDISLIYKSINYVVTNMISEFNRIEQDLAWKSFKIIIVLRRTSIGLLDSALLHSPTKSDLNINDVTGHFQVSKIWSNKKKYIWNNLLKNRFCDDNSIRKIEILDIIMKDDERYTGISYQSIIAPLMSYGIRRNARSQAHAAYKTFEVLSNNDKETLNYEEFQVLFSEAGGDNSTIIYMFRRALVEFQFKWSISNSNQDRWKNLGIGHLEKEKDYVYMGKRITIEEVSYCNEVYVTLMRRILAFLSSFPDSNNVSYTGKHKSVVDMFSTISIYDLIKGVLINPKEKNKINDNDFLQLSRVLIALSDMSNNDTRCAPYIILGINDIKFHIKTEPEVLADILKDIWHSGAKDSLPGNKYSSDDFGVRITDAGYSFVLDWQASFSFMASLHCFTIPPLFFLKDTLSIKYVIETVYNASENLCKMYEAEARRFCQNSQNMSLKAGAYLPKYNNRSVTLRKRIKELHINHLNLYRTFVENNYKLLKISEEDKQELTSRDDGVISYYIMMYAKWKTGEGAKECF